MNKRICHFLLIWSVLTTPLWAQGGGVAKVISHAHVPPPTVVVHSFEHVHTPPPTIIHPTEFSHPSPSIVHAPIATRLASTETHAATSIEHARPQVIRHESAAAASFTRPGIGGGGSGHGGGSSGGGGGGAGRFSRTEAFNNAAIGKNVPYGGPHSTNFKPSSSKQIQAPRLAQKSDAAALVSQNGGKNRVTLTSQKMKMEVDLAGGKHHVTETPHTKVSLRNFQAPDNLIKGKAIYNTKSAITQPTTQQELRTVRRYLDRRK